MAGAAADLCLRPRRTRELPAMLEAAARLGYGVVAVEEPGDWRGSRGEFKSLLRRLAGEHGVEAYTRVTFEASTGSQVVEEARRLVVEYDLVAVKPSTAEAARIAARDPRVALVLLPPSMARYMDRSEAEMIAAGGGAVELRLAYLAQQRDPRRTLRGLLIVARRAAAYEAPLVVTSGARSVWGLWHPASAASLLVVLGLPPSYAKLAVTGFPRRVIATKRGGG